MISYTRARAEGLGVRCDIGMMQRAERVILIGFAALIFGEATLFGVKGLALRAVIVGLAVLTNITVVQRIVWVYRHSRPHGRPAPDAAVEPPAADSRFAEPPGA